MYYMYIKIIIIIIWYPNDITLLEVNLGVKMPRVVLYSTVHYNKKVKIIITETNYFNPNELGNKTL